MKMGTFTAIEIPKMELDAKEKKTVAAKYSADEILASDTLIKNAEKRALEIKKKEYYDNQLKDLIANISDDKVKKNLNNNIIKGIKKLESIIEGHKKTIRQKLIEGNAILSSSKTSIKDNEIAELKLQLAEAQENKKKGSIFR